MDEALVETAAPVVQQAKTNAPIGVTRNLSRTIAFSPPYNERMGFRAIGIGLTGGSDDKVRYGVVMEKGRRPGKKPPPAESLHLWVERKLKVGMSGVTNVQTRRTTWRKRGNADMRQKMIERVAFLVARKIGKEGIEGKHFMGDAFERFLPQLPENFRRRYESLKSLYNEL